MAYNLIQEVVNEGRHRPFTLCLLLVLLGATLYGWHSYARAEDVQQRISALERKVDKTDSKVDRLLAFELEDQISRNEHLLCSFERGTAQYYNLQRTIRTLRSDYRAASGREAKEHTC
jgi:hypothetical protein